MKVLFVGNPSTADTDGGSATLERAIRSRLEASPERVFMTPRPQIPGGVGEVAQRVRTQDIDLVWFLSPYYEAVPVPFVTTVWDLGHRTLPYFPEVSTAPAAWSFAAREQFYSHVLPRASRVIIGNESGARDLIHFYGVSREHIRIIPLCVDVDALRSLRDGISQDQITALGLTPQEYLLYPAQFWPHKNHVTLVDMLKILREYRDHPLKLVLTGADKGNQAYVQDYVRQTGLSDSVIFTGFVSIDTLHQLYRGALACVYASLMGPDNLPPLEAMALECPVICADYRGAVDQLGDAAVYFRPLDAIDAADRVSDLIQGTSPGQPWNSPLPTTLIERGSEYVKKFTPDRYVWNVQQVLTEFERTRRLWAPAGGSLPAYRHL